MHKQFVRHPGVVHTETRVSYKLFVHKKTPVLPFGRREFLTIAYLYLWLIIRYLVPSLLWQPS